MDNKARPVSITAIAELLAEESEMSSTQEQGEKYLERLLHGETKKRKHDEDSEDIIDVVNQEPERPSKRKRSAIRKAPSSSSAKKKHFFCKDCGRECDTQQRYAAHRRNCPAKGASDPALGRIAEWECVFCQREPQNPVLLHGGCVACSTCANDTCPKCRQAIDLDEVVKIEKATEEKIIVRIALQIARDLRNATYDDDDEIAA